MIKNNFILLNNSKNDFSQFSYYEPNENHSINKLLFILILKSIYLSLFFG